MKPILFNTEMVRAVLDGRKTVTRRIMKPQPENVVGIRGFHYRGDVKVTEFLCKKNDPIRGWYDWIEGVACPYNPGDVLYVRETWARLWSAVNPEKTRYVYKASDIYPFGEKYIASFRWSPSIHMPKEAARIFLRVTDVRVERLQDITDEQAMAEGIRKMYDYLSDEEYDNWSKRVCPGKKKSDWGWDNYLWHGYHGKYGLGNKISDAWEYQRSAYNDPKGSFSSLWNSTLSIKDWDKYGWDANPWVWVNEFERISKEEAYNA